MCISARRDTSLDQQVIQRATSEYDNAMKIFSICCVRDENDIVAVGSRNGASVER